MIKIVQVGILKQGKKNQSFPTVPYYIEITERPKGSGKGEVIKH